VKHGDMLYRFVSVVDHRLNLRSIKEVLFVVFLPLSNFYRLAVFKITQKVINGFWWFFGRVRRGPGPCLRFWCLFLFGTPYM